MADLRNPSTMSVRAEPDSAGGYRFLICLGGEPFETIHEPKCSPRQAVTIAWAMNAGASAARRRFDRVEGGGYA